MAAAGLGAGGKLQEQQILTKDHPSNYGTSIAKGNTMEGREGSFQGSLFDQQGEKQGLKP